MPAPAVGLVVTRPALSATLALIVRAEQHGSPADEATEEAALFTELAAVGDAG